MQPPGLEALSEFLKECPEHIQGTRTGLVDGREEVLIDTTTLVAFSRWAVAKGYVPLKKAERFLAMLRGQCKEKGIPWPEEPTR